MQFTRSQALLEQASLRELPRLGQRARVRVARVGGRHARRTREPSAPWRRLSPVRSTRSWSPSAGGQAFNYRRTAP